MLEDSLFLSWHVSLALAIAHLAGSASAFSFSYTTPTQCDNFTVNWQGGQPPFNLLVIPPSQTLQNFSIPSSNFDTNTGLFSTQLALKENSRVMFAMSDATGITAGGISPLLSVGSSTSGVTCNTTVPTPDFFFSLNSDLKECMPYTFSQYSGATLPITIMGFIPSGPFFSSSAPNQGDTYVWKNPYPAGMPISFTVVDSQGRNGGSSDIKTVMTSGDTSCMSQTVSLTHGSLTSTSTSGSSTQTAPSPSSTESSSEARTDIIIGSVVVIGGILLVLAVIVYFLCWRRRRRAAKVSKDKMGAYELLAPNIAAPEGAAELVSRQIVRPFPLPGSTLSQQSSGANSNLAVTPFPLPVPVPPIVVSPSEKFLYHTSQPSTSSLTPTHSSLGHSSSPQARALPEAVTPSPIGGYIVTTSRPEKELYPDNRPSTSSFASTNSFVGLLTPHAGTSRSTFAHAQPQVTMAAQTSLYNPDAEAMDLPPEYSENGPQSPPVQTLSARSSSTSLQPVRRS